MFGSKSLLSCKRAGTLCLFYASKARKTKEISSIGVVKYNKENKYLFGDLLETRAQRRKTLKKVNKSIFKNLKKHVSDIKSKLLNALLNETRFLTLSKVYCRSNYPNSCLFSSNEFLRLNPISYLSPVSTNVKYISVSPDGGSRLNEERDAYDIGIARAERWNKCLTRIAIPVSTPHYSDRFINNIKSTNVIYCHDNKSHLNDPRRISAVYRTKKKNRLLDNVAFKPYSFAKRFIHRRTKLKTLGLQRNKKDLEDERHSFNNSLEDVMEKSFKSCNQNLAGTKLSSSKNHVIRTKYTPDGIKSIGLSRRSDNSAHKRKSILPKWDNRLSVNKKSIYFTVNPKKIHTNSKYQFKHRNNTNGLSRNSKKENGFLERHDKFPTCDFSIESLAIKDQKQKDGSDWLNSNPPVSLANSQKKVYRIPELVRGGLNSYKFNKKVIFSRNRSLIKNDSKFTTCGLSHEETRENRSQSSRNEYSQLSHFLQKTSSKNIKKNDLVPFCNLEKYLKNMRGLDTPKSIAKSPHFSKMSPHKTVDKFEEDSNPLLINKNQIYSSFWPNRPKTSKFTNTKETSLQGKYSSTGDISSLLFPKKYSIGSTLPHSDRKFNQGYKFKVHNNTLKASNDSFFKVPCNMIVGKNKKPNHILPVTDNAFFVASNELNDGLECIKSTDKSNKNSSDCNIENALKYDIPTTNNVKPNINLNKYFSVVQSGNPINGDNNQHVDLNSNPKKARISDLIFQRTLCRKESSLKSCVESCKVDNSSPEIYQEKENMGAESKKILEKSTFNLFNGSHTHNNNYCEENVKKRMLQKEPEVTIHCNDLKLKENRIEKPKEPQLSIDFLKNSSSNKFTDNPGINYEINKLSKPKLVESIFNYKRSLHEVNHKVSDAVIKNASDENVFKAKDKTEKSHSGLNLSKSPRNENLSFRFEHSLLDSNNSLNVLTNEKHEIKLLNSRPNKNGESDNSQNSYPIGNTRGWGISQYLSCDHRKISSIEQNKNNFDRVPSKSILKVGNLFQNKIVSKNSDLLNDYSNKQDQSIVEDQPEVSISNTPSNHNNHEKVDLIKDYENNSTKKTIEMQKVCFKLTNSQCLPTNNIDISQFSKKINDKKELEIHNKVSEKHCDVMKTSKSYTTPYYSTLNSYRSDIGNDSSNSQYAFGENISAIRRHSTFDRAPYYHSVEESNPLHGGLSKYLYCSSSTSGSSEFITKNLSSIVSNSIFKDSFGFCHRRFDKKTQLDTSSISHSNSKLSFEKEKRVERNSKYNFSAKTPENTEIESTSKTDDFSFKLNTLMREKDIITYDLKAIIDFCLSLNIPPKTEMNHKDVPATSFDENKIESNYKIHKIYDEIVLNMMKTMIKTFPPKEAVEDIYKSNIDNGNSGLIQSILCPKHKHKQNGNDTFKNVIQGYNSKKIVNKSVEFRSHISNTDFLKNESHLIENRDPEFFRDFQSFQNKVEKSPIEGTSNSDHVPRTNMNSSNRNKNGLLLDESGVNENSLHKDLVISNQNSNQCKPLSHFKECDQVQKVLGYQDSHTFQNNPSLQNHEEIDFGNSAKKADDPPISLDNVFINEDDNFHNPTSSWNISDRQKYFKLTSTLRTAITYLNTIDKQGDLDKSKSSVRKSMTDRDKFKYFSNFLKESVIKRENILKQLEIVPFKNVSVTSESDPLPCLGNKSTDVHISSLINLNCKQIELSNNTFKELENQTSNNGDVLKILELRENSDIHIPDEQSIERKYLGTALNIGLLENISPSDASKLPIKNNSELLSNHLSTSSNQKNDCVSLKKVGDASTLGGGSQSYLSLNGSSENSSNGLNKFESLLRHSSSSDTKTKFFKSLKLSACRQISNYSVKSEITSEHTQSLNYSESFPDVSEFDEKIVNKGRLSISSVYPQNSLPKVLSRGKIAFPEILENYCVLQERDLAAKGEGHLKEESGNYLEEITTETRSKTIQKQNSKSKLSKTSVDNESYSTVIGTNNFGKLSGDCSTENSRYNSPGKKLNFDDENASETINLSLNETSKSNRNIAQANDESFVISLFPLINLRKSHLKYEACVEPVINISYESLCKNVLSSLPSVGKILSETMPAAARAALERWKQNMIAQLGEEGFQKLNKENLARGALFHEYVRRYLVGETSNDDLPEKVQYYFKSLAAVFPHISDVKVVESHVTHPQLHYCGFIDCVAKYDGTPVVIEWKLAEKPKPDIRSTYDAPLQMSAYLGALNYDDNYNFPVASGVVVAAYTDGSPANVFYLPQEKCVTYWESFQKRLQEYKKMKSVKLK